MGTVGWVEGAPLPKPGNQPISPCWASLLSALTCVDSLESVGWVEAASPPKPNSQAILSFVELRHAQRQPTSIPSGTVGWVEVTPPAKPNNQPISPCWASLRSAPTYVDSLGP